MRRLASSLVGLLLAVAGCKDTSPPGCRIAQSTTLPASPLTLTSEVTVQRAGAGLVLVGAAGDDIRWAPLGLDGTLGTESTLTLPQRLAKPAPVFATTGKSAPGDQLVVAFVAPKAGAANQFQILAITQMPGGAAAAPVPLADLPPGVDPNIVRLAMGPSQTGQRAVLAWAFEGQDAPPSLVLLQADGQPAGMPAPVVAMNIPRGSCLQVMPSRGDFAVSITEGGAAGLPSIWRTFERNDDGKRPVNVEIHLDHVNVGCISAAPTPRGYVLAYQNNDGTYFSDFNIDKGTINSDIVAGVLQFGGAAKQPKVACIAPMGSEYSLLFDRVTGPEVWRFNAFGDPQGASLFLPSSAGQIGPLSALPGKDTFHATYLDQGRGSTGGNPSGNTRYLVRVDCPMATPFVSPDAAAPAGADAAAGEAGK
ncbi:MAG TPA: hypothetical protein VN914_07515 [Polyangia bacterium]|nr:hypothetical protein [Polyangia bacterium]